MTEIVAPVPVVGQAEAGVVVSTGGTGLVVGGVTLTTVGLVGDTDALTLEQHRQIIALCDYAEGCVQWCRGDSLQAAERRHGEKYADLLDPDGGNYQSLNAEKWVAGRVDFMRRRINLSWSHHREVAADEPDEQDRWLDEAEHNNWTRKELRQNRRQGKLRDKALTAAESYAADEAVRVVHGDCLDMIAELPDGSVSLLLTDPPYAVTDNAWDTWETDDDYWSFMSDWLAAMRPKMADEFSAFIFCDADASPMLWRVLHDTGWPVLRQAIWHRPNLAKKRSGSLTFLSAYEPFWHCGTRPLILPDEWGNERFDVQTVAVPQSTHTADPSYHPTQKPLELFRRLIRIGSEPGALVVDPFVGSGTSAVAARDEVRRFVGSDASGEYVEIAKGRLTS